MYNTKMTTGLQHSEYNEGSSEILPKVNSVDLGGNNLSSLDAASLNMKMSGGRRRRKSKKGVKKEVITQTLPFAYN